MGSMHLAMEGIDHDGSALAAFYRERALGGAGLIVTGGSAVSRVGAAGRNYSFINDDADAEKLAAAAAGAHEGGARILLQLFHAGRYAPERTFGLRPLAPSAVYSALSRSEPRAMDQGDIDQTLEDFTRGAARARDLGFDGVEIMGSEGYLLNQFMAPETNLRTDEWGGDSERRRRFPLAVAAAVRAAAGAGQAVVYRISAVDLVSGGATQEEVLELAGELTASGSVDALSVGVGWHEAKVPTVQAVVPYGAWTPWARALREAVNVPVIASNRINTLELADAVLRAGDCDFVSIARPFLADPELIRKGREADPGAEGDPGREGEPGREGDPVAEADPGREGRTGARRALNVCIACNQCIDNSIFDRPVSCVVNPRAGHELDPVVDGRGARVAVVGGGPAGMEAARALAASGHRVRLLEAGPQLGGQFLMAGRIPGKEDFLKTVAYFEQELTRLGVDVSLGERITDAAALTEFAAVIVATGVTPRRVALEGAGLAHVRSYAELLLADDPRASIEGSVAIIGAGGIGVDIAHLLSRSVGGDPLTEFYERYGLRGMSTPTSRSVPSLDDRSGSESSLGSRPESSLGSSPESFLGSSSASSSGPDSSPTHASQITLMRREGRIGDGIGPSTRWVMLQELDHAGVTMLSGVSYERIERDAVVITTAEGELRRIPAQTVVIAAGQESQAALAGALVAAGRPHVVIGGAADARGLDAGRAFAQGARAPAAVAAALAAA
jgi:2,4-dienoyl-CoA reductase (NADPH2)